jgi:UMF1 family MFS transporter
VKDKDPADGKRSRHELFGWVMFDFANSSFTTVIVTVIFSAYFVSHIVGDKISGVKYWGWGVALSNLIVISLAPVAGAIADYSGSKKRFLVATSLICVIFTALLFFAREGNILLALTFFIIANIGFSAGEGFIAAFLPEIAKPEEMGKISGYGWAFGYVGGLVSLLLCLALFKLWGQGELQIRFTFVLTALFFLMSAIPTFLFLRERKEATHLPAGKGYLAVGFGRIRDTFREIQTFRQLPRFLFSFFLYSCGIATVISFSAIYAENVLHFTKAETLIFFIVVQVASSAGAFCFGLIEDRIGAKKTIAVTLLIWLVVIVLVYWSPTKAVFWIAGNLAGLAIGASQSSSRALVALFTPAQKSGEFFGFWGLSGKLAATVGIYAYSMMTQFTGSMRIAILSTGVFFLLGLLALFFVDEVEGKKAASSYKKTM